MSATPAGRRPHELDDPEFGKKLYRALMKSGMSPAELARQSGVSRGLVSKYLHGEVPKPGFDKVGKLAQALNVEPEELYRPASAAIGKSVPALKSPVGRAYATLQQYLSLEASLKIAAIIRDDMADG